MAPLVADLGGAYAAALPGGPRTGRPCRCSIARITRCGSAELSGRVDPDPDGDIAAQVAYWKQALAGLPERLELRRIGAYPVEADHQGASVAVEHGLAELQQQVARCAPRA